MFDRFSRVLVSQKKITQEVPTKKPNFCFSALDLLLRQADKTSGPLKGHLKTVEYLQKLGESIFNF